VNKTIQDFRRDREQREVEARIVAMYEKFPKHVVRILAYMGYNYFVNRIANNFEYFGRMTVRQMYAAITVIKQIDGEPIHKRPGASAQSRRIDSLVKQVKKLTEENAWLRQGL